MKFEELNLDILTQILNDFDDLPMVDVEEIEEELIELLPE